MDPEKRRRSWLGPKRRLPRALPALRRARRIPNLVGFSKPDKIKRPRPSHRKTGATSAGGPVSRILSRTAIPLGASLLARSSDLPGGFRSATACAALDGPRGRAGPARARSIGPTARLPPYLVLLRVGFTMPPPLPPERCALTAPFHPYSGNEFPERYVFCGTGRLRALKPASRTLSGTLPCGVRTFLPRWQHACAHDTGSDRPVLLPKLF